jgi:diadenosine tetraphosphatase ApaH/serine/threonine PP2A family protein phosphatase
MSIAILTDIHANREALEACLVHAGAAGVERYAILGDVVGYGADPAWCVERVAALGSAGAIVLMGNHDEAVFGSEADMNGLARAAIAWTRGALAPDHVAYLRGLPYEAAEGECLFVHANAYAPAAWDYVTGAIQAGRSLSHTDRRVTFAGHVHVPALYHAAATGAVASFDPVAGVDIPLLRQRRWFAVVGAVGQPRDGIPGANYAVFDPRQSTLRFVRVAYDIETAARKIREAGLPEALALRLERGR